MNSLISLDAAELTSWMGTMWWPFVRFSALLWAMPVFSNPAVTPRARILFAFFLSFLIAPHLDPVRPVDPFSIDMAVITLEQVLFGVFMGLSLRLLFEVMAQVGLVLSMQMGLSMAIVMNPGSGNQVALLGHLFYVMAALMFFAIDGHLVTLQVVVDSFTLWPVGESLYRLNIGSLVSLVGWLFASSLIVALPAVIAMMLVNLTFGVASRAAPSLNIFVLGFPMALIMGFVSVFMTLTQTGGVFSELTRHTLSVMRGVMGG